MTVKDVAVQEYSELVELLAKKLCEFKGIDPNFVTTGLGILAPPGVEYPLWRAWADEVKFIIDEYALESNFRIREKYDDGMIDDRI